MAETIDTYGIDETIEGYTVESANVKKIPVQEQIHGQHNEVRQEIKYDLRKDLSCTLRGAVEPTAATFDGFGGAGEKWIIDSVDKAGTYNGIQRWNVSAHNSVHCNTVTDITPVS